MKAKLSSTLIEPDKVAKVLPIVSEVGLKVLSLYKS